MKNLYFENSTQWREWLKNNYDMETEVWLIFYKKGGNKGSLSYESTIEEALCFGWIDSIVKRIDDEKYVRKFTPRKCNSEWSQLNKRRVTKLIAENRMTKAGLEKVNIAKLNGQWHKKNRLTAISDIPNELKVALDTAPEVKKKFEQTSSHL